MFDSKSFGSYIKRCRENIGLKIEGMASMINISDKYYQSIEAGREVPSVETAINILNTLGVSFTPVDDGESLEKQFESIISSSSNDNISCLNEIIDLLLESR